MKDVPDAVRQLFTNMVNELNQDLWNRQRQAAEADPKKHKLSLLMQNTAYRYVHAGKDGRGRDVYFCWSCHRNVAGYFLGWRETVGKWRGPKNRRVRPVKRDQWVARKVRRRARELAQRREARFRERHSPAARIG